MGGSKSVSSSERLLAYLVLDERMFGEASRAWTGRDVKYWSKFVKAQGVFRRGAKGAIEGMLERELTYSEVADLFVSDEALEQAVEPSLEWFASHLTSEGHKALSFPIEIVRRRSCSALPVPRLYP